MQRHNSQREKLVSGYCKKITVVVLSQLIYEYIRDSEWFSVCKRNDDKVKYGNNNQVIQTLCDSKVMINGMAVTDHYCYGNGEYIWHIEVYNSGTANFEIGLSEKHISNDGGI